MKNTTILNAFVIITTLLFLGCQKEPSHIGIDAALRADFEYGPGSYWLYRDTATGQVDSLYFFSKNMGQVSSNVSGNIYDQLGQAMYQVHSNPGTVDTIARWVLRLEENRLWFEYVPKAFINTSLSLQTYSSYGFSYPFATGSINFPKCKVDMLPSYTVLGTSYPNVARLYALALKDEDYVHITREQGMISIAQKHEGYETVTRTYELVKAVIVR